MFFLLLCHFENKLFLKVWIKDYKYVKLNGKSEKKSKKIVWLPLHCRLSNNKTLLNLMPKPDESEQCLIVAWNGSVGVVVKFLNIFIQISHSILDTFAFLFKLLEIIFYQNGIATKHHSVSFSFSPLLSL